MTDLINISTPQEEAPATASPPATERKLPPGEPLVSSSVHSLETPSRPLMRTSDAGPKSLPMLSAPGASSKVEVVVRPVPRRGGRPAGPEKYPFGILGLTREGPHGSVVGPSFTIPLEDHPVRRLAAARKRHPRKKFMSRKTTEGVAIWRIR